MNLYHAAKAGDVVELLRILAGGYADVNWVNEAEERRTAVHVACAAGHAVALECLLLNGGDMLVKDEKDMAPLDYANSSGSFEVVSVLIAHSS